LGLGTKWASRCHWASVRSEGYCFYLNPSAKPAFWTGSESAVHLKNPSLSIEQGGKVFPLDGGGAGQKNLSLSVKRGLVKNASLSVKHGPGQKFFLLKWGWV